MLTENSIKIFIFTILLILSSSSSVIGDIKDIDEDSLAILDIHHWNDNQTKNKERNDIQDNELVKKLTVFPNGKQYQLKNIPESLTKILSTIFDDSFMLKIYKESGIDEQTSGNENYDNYEYIKFQGSTFPSLQFGYSKNLNHNRFPPIDYPNYRVLALIQSLINKFYENDYLLRKTKNYSKRNENSTKPSKTDIKEILSKDFSNDEKLQLNRIKNKRIFKPKNMIKIEDEMKQINNINDRYQSDIFSELNSDDNSEASASSELKLLRKPIFQDSLMNYPIKKIITKVERFNMDYPQPRSDTSKILPSSLENEDKINIHSPSNYIKNAIKNLTDSITFKANEIKKENGNLENLNENSEIQNVLDSEEINNFDPIFYTKNKDLLISDRAEYEASQKQFQHQFRKRENELIHKKSIREVPEPINKDKNISKYFNVPKIKVVEKINNVFYPIKASIENDNENIQENNNESENKNIYGKSENFQKLNPTESDRQVDGTKTISIGNKSVFYLFPLTKFFGKYKMKNHLKKNIIQIDDEFLSYPFNRDYGVYIRNKRSLLPQNTHIMQTHFGLKENLIFKKSHSNLYSHIRNKRSFKLRPNILTNRRALFDIHLNHNVSNPNREFLVETHLMQPKEERNKIDQIGQFSKIRNFFNEPRTTHLHEAIKDRLLKNQNIIHSHRETKDHNLHLLKDHGNTHPYGRHEDHNMHLLNGHSIIRSHRVPKDHFLHLLKAHIGIRPHRTIKDRNVDLFEDNIRNHLHGMLKTYKSNHPQEVFKNHMNIRHRRIFKDDTNTNPHGVLKVHNIQLFKDHNTFPNAMTKNRFDNNFGRTEFSEDGNYFKIKNHMIPDGKFNPNQMNLDSFSHLEKFTDPLDFNPQNFKEAHYDDFSKGFHDCKIDENFYDPSKAWQDDRIRENIDYILLMSLNDLFQTYFPGLSEMLSFGLMLQSDGSNYNINPVVFQCSKWNPSGLAFNLPLSQDGTQTKFFLVLFPNWDNYLNNMENIFKIIKENQSSEVNEASNTSTAAAPEIIEHENVTTSNATDKVNETISNSEAREESPEDSEIPKTDKETTDKVDKETESNPLSKILSDFLKNTQQLKNEESTEKFVSELKFLAQSERGSFIDKLDEIVNKFKKNTENSESSNPKVDDTKAKEENENPEDSNSTKEEDEDAMEISQEKV